MAGRPLVSIIDDDESVSESLPDLLKEIGYDAQAFASAEEYLSSGAVGKADCLILDIGLPGMSGPSLYEELLRRGDKVPVVFITARGDETIRSRLMEQGAVECLFKPFSDTALLRALDAAVRKI